MTLFRKESIDSFEGRFMGKPALKFPLPITLVSYTSLLILLLFFVFIYLGSYTRRVQARGIVAPQGDVIRIYSNHNGLIDKVHVHDGMFVKKGDVLFTIVNEKVNNDMYVEKEKINIIKKRIRLTQESLNNHDLLLMSGIDSLKNQLDASKKELDDIEHELNLLTDKLNITSENYKKNERLFSLNVIAASQVSKEKLHLIEVNIDKNEVITRKNKVSRNIKDIKQKLLELPIKSKKDKLEIERELLDLQTQLIDIESDRVNQITSPIDGVISSINSLPGKNISLNHLMAVLSPKNAIMDGVLYIPNKAIGFIKKGDSVKIRFDAFPYQKFGFIHGHVEHVSLGALLPSEIPEITKNTDMLYGVRLRLEKNSMTAYGREVPLKASMTFEADIMLERRKLYEWVLEPLYTITGKM